MSEQKMTLAEAMQIVPTLDDFVRDSTPENNPAMALQARISSPTPGMPSPLARRGSGMTALGTAASAGRRIDRR